MRWFIYLLVAIGMMGCSSHQAAKPSTPNLVKKKVPKTETLPCKALYEKTGKHCVVIIARCRVKPSTPRVTLVSVAITDTTNKGKLAAEESLTIIAEYFGSLPKLRLLTTSNIEGTPLYIFLVISVEPPPLKLPNP